MRVTLEKFAQINEFLSECPPVITHEGVHELTEQPALRFNFSLFPYGTEQELVSDFLIERRVLETEPEFTNLLCEMRQRAVYQCLKVVYENEWKRLVEKDLGVLFPWGLP